MEDLLPEDVMLDIFSRLSVETIICCKCVCKKWQNLVLGSYFVHLHLTRSPVFLLIDRFNQRVPLKLVETEVDELDHNRLLGDPFLSLNIAHLIKESAMITPLGSVNGLICLWIFGYEICDKTYICNPVTNEYIILPEQHFHKTNRCGVRYGFGVSMATREYKVIRIFSDQSIPFEIEVYTLGTDQWRTLHQYPSEISRLKVWGCNHGVYFNGQVHWIVGDQLLSFDLDNETFQLVLLPPATQGVTRRNILGVLKGVLTLCSVSCVGFTSIWVMKESWHKELDIKESFIRHLDLITWFPLCLNDGLNGKSILMVCLFNRDPDNCQLMAYCPETNTIEDMKMPSRWFGVITYRPSFLKLQNFQAGRVHHF